LRRLAEQELANGHASEAADVVDRQLAPLRPAIDDPLVLAKVDRVEANVPLTLGRSVEAETYGPNWTEAFHRTWSGCWW
jgi:hypothetical protein